jgi:hypothetical protein
VALEAGEKHFRRLDLLHGGDSSPHRREQVAVKVTGRSKKDVELQGPIGPSLAIALSESGDSQFRFHVVVKARTHEGVFIVGEFKTEPPKDVQARGGSVGAVGVTGATDPLFRSQRRLVAVANWPGAIGWMITVDPLALTSDPPTSSAATDWFLSSLAQATDGPETGAGGGAKCCSDFSPPAPGVYPVHSDGAIGPHVYEVLTAPIVNIGTTPMLVSPANPYRRRLLLRAQNANPVVIGQNNGVALATGFHVISTETTIIDHQRAVWAVAIDATRGALDVYEEQG